MHSIKRVLVMVIFSLMYSNLIHAADITGKWQGEFDSMIGKQVYIYTISVVNDTLTGEADADIAGEKYHSTLSDFKLTENEVQFTESLDYQGMPLVIIYKGKIDGDKIHFSRTVGDFEPEVFVAQRIQPKEDTKK